MNQDKRLEIEKLITSELTEAKQEKLLQEDPDKLIDELHKTAIINQVKTDEETNKKFIEQAKKTVNNELETINQDNIARRQKATYNANLEACRCYGIESAVPLWQVYLMRVGHAFWFFIYWIVATLTICPINVFVTGINAFIKRTWLSLILAIISYLFFTIALPLIIIHLKGGG